MSTILLKIQEEVKSSNGINITSSWLNHTGIEEYFPEELVITVRSSTPIAEICAVLAKNNQVLPFYIDDKAQSIGAAYAIGAQDLSDSVLGVQIIDGSGELLNFGGQVMKNVAGYDVARMLVGSRGRLAVVTQISFKVMPSQYVGELKFRAKTAERSVLREEVEKRLKTVFDPRGVFS
jgi:glycolate oxidase FAD binding subunit